MIEGMKIDNTEFGLNGVKDLYDAALIARSDTVIQGKEYKKGDIVLFFNKILLAQIMSRDVNRKASGGKNNQKQVIWDYPEDIKVRFSQGIFSWEQLSYFMNGNLGSNNTILIPEKCIKEADENGEISLVEFGDISNLKIRNKKNFDKNIELIEANNKLIGLKPYELYILFYNRLYNKDKACISFGEIAINEELTFIGKTRIQDSGTGDFYTGIIEIPRLHIESRLNITLGSNAYPIVPELWAEALKVKENGELKAINFYKLNEYLN